MFKWERVDENAPSDRADFIRVWALELFNPKRKQTAGALKKKQGNCCLGVGCEVAKIPAVKLKNGKFGFGEFQEQEALLWYLADFLKMGVCGDIKVNYFIINAAEKERERKEIAAVTKFLNSAVSLIEANDSLIPFHKIGTALVKYPKAFFRQLSNDELEYINATPIPTWQDYSAARKAHNDSLKANKGDNHDSV